MNKQDYLDFITTVCNECVTKGHNRYAGEICKMSNNDIDCCADRVGYKPKSKFEILEGEVTIHENEGGYCSSGLQIGDEYDFVNWVAEKYGYFKHGCGCAIDQKLDGVFRITIEKIKP